MGRAIVIGDLGGEHVRLTAFGRERGNTGDYDDDNWLAGEIAVRVSGFQGHYAAAIRSDDYAALRQALDRVQGRPEPQTWEPLEPWITLTVKRGSDGFTVEGTALERVGYGNSLRFSFETSAASLATAREQVDALLADFPVPKRD